MAVLSRKATAANASRHVGLAVLLGLEHAWRHGAESRGVAVIFQLHARGWSSARHHTAPSSAGAVLHFRTLPPAAATMASARNSTEPFCIACFRSSPRRSESAHLAWDTDAPLFASRADIQSRQRSLSFPRGQRVLRVQSPHPDFTWLCGHGAQVAQWCFNLPCGQLAQTPQLPFRLPCGQGQQVAQLCFRFPCGHRLENRFTTGCGTSTGKSLTIAECNFSQRT